ncbi:hypothetical protein PRZ48_000462 [Zasmidium cellare]|uniref:Prolyl 4-hydroxylase alpha subunit Fe(2+) 2OG dioxygenase domain-containing protein n=1 Tax=Zasmidium cellare TaxID=395010 RepID=A0ABR0EZE2_ZASCE|nr:hypothetical protein PRZ48_000462 [Zasmidium cellare]
MDSDSDGSERGRSPSPGADLKDDLFEHISQIQSAGTFATFREIDNFVLPGISIDPVGPIRLPLSQEDAQTLVGISRQAPFGNGFETVVDESVRRTWEIDGTAVKFLNPKWQSCLDEIVESVAEDLGIVGGSKNVRAELYKMLLYEKGAMFKPHQDTEKVDGMFGTLIICLPSEHEGGTVCLQHGNKRERLNTGAISAFGATYLAWYADVLHEIEPVTSGYRWVLTYNLIKTSPTQTYSASELDSRTEHLTRLFRQWEGLEDPYHFLTWPLDFKYTKKSLKLALLKGNDSNRVRHVAQSCAEHGQFYCFLANMELCITDYQTEDQDTHSRLRLSRVVDLDGFDLMPYHALTIPKSTLLHRVHNESRAPDAQSGGGYTGNQHAEIDQIYEDSVMILIPKREVLPFLVTEKASPSILRHFIGRMIQRFQSNGYDQASKEFLVQICTSALSMKWASSTNKNFLLGYVAVAAAFLQDPSLFKRVVDESMDIFTSDAYSELGTLISFPQEATSEGDDTDGKISEDDFIRALTRSKALHKTYDALKSFEGGFLRGNPDREQMVPKDYVERWLDSIAVEYFQKLQSVNEHDARTLVRAILDRSNNDFRQNIIYQSVRTLVSRFRHEDKFLIALAVELLNNLPGSGDSQKYLHTLLHQILDAVVSIFDLEFYDHYVETLHTRGPTSTPNTGPIIALYETATEPQRITLLDNIQKRSLSLSQARWRDFIPAFLKQLITVVDASSPEGQQCVQSLVNSYITTTVGAEPPKPSDWRRPAEVVTYSYPRKTCSCIAQLNDFLLDATASTCELSCKDAPGYYCDALYKFDGLDQKRAGNAVTYTKTLKGWEREHRDWKGKADQATRVLRQLPEERLRACLAGRYEEVMELRSVKVAREGGSVSPSKRAWTDD